MARPRTLTPEQESLIAEWGKTMSPRAAHEKAQGLGWSCSEATVRRIIDRGGPGAAVAGVASVPASPLPDDADDLDVLRALQRRALTLACAPAEGGAAQRVVLAAMQRAEALTAQILRIERERAPDRKTAILILPAEGSL